MSEQPAVTKQQGFPLRLLLFWLALFQLSRLLLIIIRFDALPADWPLAFIYALRLDFSAACYLSVLPLLFYAGAVFSQHLYSWARRIVIAEIIITSILLLANIQVFLNWGTLLNRRAITFLSDPGAIFSSLSFLQTIAILLCCVIGIYLLVRVVRKFIFQFSVNGLNKWKIFFIRFTWILLLPLGIRGGLQLIPVNESAAAFSNDMQLNMITMNPPWYFINNLLKSGIRQENPYNKFAAANAKSVVGDLFQSPDSTINILTTAKPAVVIIILESWTADIIGTLGGDSATTPFFNSLCKEGLLFTRIYSSGRRTDQMFPSILSGFPAQPDHSIVRFPSKTAALPMMSRDLNRNGYSTSFYYGGELGFANMKNYLLQGQFGKLISKEDFSNLDNLSKWGAHDEYVLARHAKDLSSLKKPYFTMLLTLSSHEPFDVPGSAYSGATGDPEKFRTAAGYTDKCLKNYFSAVRQNSEYDSTLFILVADHGHLLPRERVYNDPSVYHIPLLLCGGALKPEFKGTKNNSIGSQHDLPATLLKQLGMEDTAYHWSNNLLNVNRQSFAYLNMDDASGWVVPGGEVVWYRGNGMTDEKFTQPPVTLEDNRVKQLTSYIKVLFDDFLKN